VSAAAEEEEPRRRLVAQLPADDVVEDAQVAVVQIAGIAEVVERVHEVVEHEHFDEGVIQPLRLAQADRLVLALTEVVLAV
jgi:hypothetical protein